MAVLRDNTTALHNFISKYKPPITVKLGTVACLPENCPRQHQYIRHFLGSVRPADLYMEMGQVHMFTLEKAAMDEISVTQMWKQCQTFDQWHEDAPSLAKIENYLSNESFPADREAKIEEAEYILYISEVVLKEQKYRGLGFGLIALRKAINALEMLPGRTIAMLQAGTVGRDMRPPELAGEKLKKHWRKLGFEPWSDSDDSWLLAALDEQSWFERRNASST